MRQLFLSLFAILCFSSELTLEEKVGQLIMAHFHGEVANDDARFLIQDVKVGSIIYYNWANGLKTPAQVKALSAGLQELASIPLLIAADQEGGIVTRLQDGFTQFPGNRALGATRDPNLAKEAAFISGLEMKAVGVNLNLAPVVDVNSNPTNPVIGVRSFGDDPHLVAGFGEQAMLGYKQAGVLATLKHFPGHGDVGIDSHEDLPIIRKTMDELRHCELIPFAKLCSSADAIMTGHILVPALDPDQPATLSDKTLLFLREELGFNGVIVSDSLVMSGVLKKCHSVDEASILALNAGCDLLILGGKLLTSEHMDELTPLDVQHVAGSIVEAVKTGRVTEARIDEAVERVLALKKRCKQPESCELNAVSSQKVAQLIASLALNKTEKEACSLQEKHVVVIAPKILQTNIEKTTLLQLGKLTETFFYTSLSPLPMEIEAAKQLAKKGDVLIVCSYNGWKHPAALELATALKELGKPWVLLCLRDPLDVMVMPEANRTFVSYSPMAVSIQAICDQLK